MHARISLVLATSFLLGSFSNFSLSAQAQESPWSVENQQNQQIQQSPQSPQMPQAMPEPVLTPTNENNYIAPPSSNQTTETQKTTTPATNQELDTLLNDPTISSGWRKPYLLGQQRFDKGLYLQAATAFKTAKKAAQKDAEHPVLYTVTNKCLMRSYMSLKDYSKAMQVYNECFSSQPPGALDEEINSIKSQLDKSYRVIDLTQFSPKAQEVLTEAQIKQIEVFPYFEADKTLVKVTAAKRFVKDTGSSDVPKIGLAKLVSFEFSEMPGQGFKIGNISGFQILAKMWVNLLESIFNTANAQNPTAQVTAEKMGFQKTVSVNIPEKVLKPLNLVLDRITSELRTISPNNQNQNPNSPKL
ncbi:hypothetical protein K2X05_12620 [bacterium]|nr:hypothetical protein [bacterium]